MSGCTASSFHRLLPQCPDSVGSGIFTLSTADSVWQRLLENSLLCALPFCCGLQYGYVGDLPIFRGIVLSMNWLRRMRVSQWIALVLIVLLVTGLGCYQLYAFATTNWLYPVLYFALLLLVTVSPIFCFRKTHYLHIHHYFIFGALAPLFSIHDPVSVVCQHLCLGIMVEGLTTWGPDDYLIPYAGYDSPA